MPVLLGSTVGHNSNFDSTGISTGVTVNAIAEANEILGSTKASTTLTLANGLWSPITDANGINVQNGEKNTLLTYSSLVYITSGGNPGFRVLTGTQADTSTWEWEALGDHLGVSLSSVKIQDPTDSASPVDDFTTGAVDVDSLRVGSLDEGGLTVTYTNEITASDDADTIRLQLKNSSGLAADQALANGDSWRVPVWNSTDYQFEGSCINITSDGSNDTVTIAGSLSVTGTLTQGTNVTAASLQVEDQYIKANDGYEAVDQTAASAQGGFLVQIGVDNAGTPTAYYQRGIIWRAEDSRWAKADFSATSTGTDATYTVSGTPTPILETATAANCHFPQATVGGALDTTEDSWNYYYMTPAAAYTFLSYGGTGTVYDIDTSAGNAISNQTMTLDGTADSVESVSGSALIATPPNTSYATHNKVRTARIFNIRAIATDENAQQKKLQLQMPDGFFYDDLMMTSVYKVTGTTAAHAREEIFGAEILDGADGSDNGIIEVQFNQLGLSAGDVFDFCIVA